jgi:hypothetical protein
MYTPLYFLSGFMWRRQRKIKTDGIDADPGVAVEQSTLQIPVAMNIRSGNFEQAQLII